MATEVKHKMSTSDLAERMKLCSKYGAEFLDADPQLTVGIALNVREGLWPINGLRIKPEGTATGWFIWAGEVASDAADFYKPLHTFHIDEWSPLISKYLGLSPGWRFLVTPDYEDVWFDPKLLELPPLEDL
jgi:hypothetical protein